MTFRVEGNIIRIEGNIFRIKGNIVRIKGNIVRIKGNIFRIKGNIVRIKGNIVRIKGNIVRIKGNIVRIKGNIVRIKGNIVRIKGNIVRIEGNTVRIKGNTVRIKGNIVRIEGNTVRIKGNIVRIEGNTVRMYGMSFHLSGMSFRRFSLTSPPGGGPSLHISGGLTKLVSVKLLNTPHPTGFGWAYTLIPTGAVFFILVVLAPYGFAALDLPGRVLKALPFAAITAFAIIFSLWLARSIFPTLMDKDQWTIGREIGYNIYDVAMIGLFNTLYLYLAHQPDEGFLPLLVRIETHTFVVGIIPVLALIAFKHQRALHHQLTLARALNEELSSPPPSGQDHRDTIKLHDEKGAFALQVPAGDILYLKAEGNYVEVFFKDPAGKVSKKLVRNRLKRIYELLPRQVFYHCHKSYIINRDHISRVEGNARDLRLITSQSGAIPVSRNKSSDLLAALQRR